MHSKYGGPRFPVEVQVPVLHSPGTCGLHTCTAEPLVVVQADAQCAFAPPGPAKKQHTKLGAQSAVSSHKNWTASQLVASGLHEVPLPVQQRPGLMAHSPSAPHVTVGPPQFPAPSQNRAREMSLSNEPQ